MNNQSRAKSSTRETWKFPKNSIVRINYMRIVDDVLGNKVFDKDTAEEFLCIWFGRKIVVEKVKTQLDVGNVTGHSVRFDILIYDVDGNVYDIELQTDPEKWPVERTDMYLSCLKPLALPKGTDYRNRKDVYLFVILEKDTKNNELCNGEFVAEFNSGNHVKEHAWYIDTSKANDSPFGELMQDFVQRDYNKMHNKTFQKRVQYYKDMKGGLPEIMSMIEDIKNEGKLEEKIEIIQEALNMGVLTVEQIAKMCSTTVEFVEQIKANNK